MGVTTQTMLFQDGIVDVLLKDKPSRVLLLGSKMAKVEQQLQQQIELLQLPTEVESNLALDNFVTDTFAPVDAIWLQLPDSVPDAELLIGKACRLAPQCTLVEQSKPLFSPPVQTDVDGRDSHTGHALPSPLGWLLPHAYYALGFTRLLARDKDGVRKRVRLYPGIYCH